MSISSITAKLRAEEVKSTRSLYQVEEETATVQHSTWKVLLRQELDDFRSPSLWRAAVAELLGTALLCIFTIGFGLKKHDQPGPSLFQVALGVGFFLAALIQALCNVSGCHVNPAVSLGFFCSKHITLGRTILYVIVQLIGAIAGSGLVRVMMPEDYIGGLGILLPGAGVSVSEALGMEIVITFLLMFVTMALVDPGRTDVQGSIPLMLGLTVTVNILLAGNISGGCMNPARNFGPALIMWNFENHWIYWAGPGIGSILGTVTYMWFFSTKPVDVKSLACCACRKKTKPKQAPRHEEQADLAYQALLQKNMNNFDKVPESNV